MGLETRCRIGFVLVGRKITITLTGETLEECVAKGHSITSAVEPGCE